MNILILILIIFFSFIGIIISIISFIFIYLFYLKLIKGQKLNNRIIWESNINEYNPSFSNNVIAIRYCTYELKSYFSYIKHYIKNKIFRKKTIIISSIIYLGFR